ncbi:MAG: hypothetical protein KBC16_02500 [Candidatus Pacebacteria bacterium]|nr:hypothetical protein [Candidatus Paceibacterota bacterium]
MKTVQFFANSFAVSVALVFGFRAFAGLVETEKPYSADAFFAGGMLVASLIALVLVACALRARHESVEMSLRLWCQNVVLTLATFIFASAVVMTFMSSLALGIVATVVGFVIYSLVLREFRDSVENYTSRKEFVLILATAIIGTLVTGLFIDDHPVLAFGIMGVLMVFGAVAPLSVVTVPENAIGVVVKTDPVAEPQKLASDGTGQLVDKRV